MAGIEELYRQARSMGAAETFGRELALDQVADAFCESVATNEDLLRRGRGAFFSGERTTSRELLERVDPGGQISSTHDVAALLWQPQRWAIPEDSKLDFFYVAREITPASADLKGKREQLIEPKVSADLLLVNANVDDNAAIVGEVKVRNDANAEMALLQALAAAAQLAPESQRKRLRSNYPDHFGVLVPAHVDVYVISLEAPTTGVKPQLFGRAEDLAKALVADGRIGRWIRRIAFLEARFEVGSFSLSRRSSFG